MNDKWRPASPTLTRRSALVGIFGPTDTGRTTLATTSRKPIAIIGTGEKLEQVWQEIPNTDDIRWVQLPAILQHGSKGLTGRDLTADNAKLAIEFLIEVWMDAFTWANTVILDTVDDAWVLSQLAGFGATKPVGSKTGRLDWGPVKGEHSAIIKYGRERTEQDDKMCILVAGEGDIYSGGKPTGRVTMAGESKTCRACDVVSQTSRNIVRGEDKYRSIVKKAWFNSKEMNNNIILENELSTIPNIMSMVTGTKPKEWE